MRTRDTERILNALTIGLFNPSLYYVRRENWLMALVIPAEQAGKPFGIRRDKILAFLNKHLSFRDALIEEVKLNANV